MQVDAIELLPLFREGDRLSSSEFLRNWEAMPHLKHAELIDGVVYRRVVEPETFGENRG